MGIVGEGGVMDSGVAVSCFPAALISWLQSEFCF
jgi:hypothetical protein